MKSKEGAISESWDDNAGAWTAAVREGRIESRVRLTNAVVVNAVRDTGAARILDVGCGEGWLCRAVSEFGVAAAGFDGSAALIAEARRLGGGEYQQLSYEEFAADPSQGGGIFDCVICNYSLIGEDIRPILRGAASVLEPAGILIVQTLHPFTALGVEDSYQDGWRSEDFKGMGGGFKTPMPWYFRTVGSWVSEIRISGFELVDCREPMLPESAMPASLLLVARRRQ